MKKKVRKAASVFLVAVCLLSALMVGRVWLDGHRESESQALAAELAMNTPKQTLPSQTEPSPEQEKAPPAETVPKEPVWLPETVENDPEMEALAKVNLDALRQINPDVVGWIRIPGTTIDFPVTQGQDNTHYLEHSWDGEDNQYGAIFLECMNTPDFSDFNTIVYGHRMNDGSMFAPLLEYAREDFWEEHPYIYLVTDAGVFRYEIFSSYTADVDSRAYGLSFLQQQTREDYISQALENSDIATGLVPEVTDRILTLSTCTRGSYESRRVVHGYLRMVLTEP